MGITFKENVSDIRNSKVVDLIHELEGYSIKVDVIDPHADVEQVAHEFKVKVTREPQHETYDGIVLAVGHEEYWKMGVRDFTERFAANPCIIYDLKGVHRDFNGNNDLLYWSL
jgi:UDP-N-acetyl-D-galactosamine dehydrogenase